jgi:hypothetical protein
MANDKIVLEDARIVFRNFSGERQQFNEEGDRNFSVVLDDDKAASLAADGWNVKTKPPREEGDPNFNHLKVKVSYRGKKPPLAILISSKGRTTLDQDMIDMLDGAEYAVVDMIIRAYDWEFNGKKGRTAYLDSIYVTLAEDELTRKYAEDEPKEKEEPIDEGVDREED